RNGVVAADDAVQTKRGACGCGSLAIATDSTGAQAQEPPAHVRARGAGARAPNPHSGWAGRRGHKGGRVAGGGGLEREERGETGDTRAELAGVVAVGRGK